jgi:hypothetical protein
MKLRMFCENSAGVTQYLERYVNDGSPSGFTEVNSTSTRTDPFGTVPWFQLYICRAPDEWFRNYGEIPNWPVGSSSDAWILLHPDMSSCAGIVSERISVQLLDRFEVVPTSSARTVQFRGAPHRDYVKLHYDAVLGRVNRSLTERKAIAGYEISTLLTEAISAGTLESKLCLMPETGARIIYNQQTAPPSEVGMIWRSQAIVGPSASSVQHMVPFFSLVSTDRFVPYDPPIIQQLMDGQTNKRMIALERLLFPIVRAYFSLIKTIGLQPEWNAQNLLVGLDEDFEITAIIMRDCGEVEKDQTRRAELGLTTAFASAPYKCISDNDETYRIRHSFAFDFKVGEYILEPIVRAMNRIYSINAASMREDLRQEVRSQMRGLPEDFFPINGKWYAHERILLTGQRPYVAFDGLKFR